MLAVSLVGPAGAGIDFLVQLGAADAVPLGERDAALQADILEIKANSVSTGHEHVMADDGDPLQLGVPAGHGQRVTYLLATVAVNQAREQAARLDAAVGRVDRGDEADWELEPRIREAMSQAETRLENIPWQNRTALVASLVDAMVWSHDSELAAQRLDELTSSYALSWGVDIDPMEFTVSVDPQFEAEHFQRYAEAASVWDRESAAIDIVTALPMPEAAKDAATRAVMAWRGTEVDPLDPDEHRLSQKARREQLDVDLAAAPITAEDRARVAFVVDYVRDDTSRVDLLTTPVVVDPGEEARGRVAGLLEQYARNPKSAREVGKQISVLTPADQERVRDVGRAIQAGQPVDFAVWPGYINREQLLEELQLYAMDAEELRAEADYIAEADISTESPERIGLSDEIGARITRMATQREQLLDQARHGKGLTSMERAQLACTIEDIDAGVIHGHKELPELLFADERTKASVDFARTAEPASELSNATRHEITDLINTTGAVTPHSREDERLRFEVSSISDAVFSVAAGSPGTGVELDRQQYTMKRTELGKALARAGVEPEVRQRIRTLVDDRARQAGELGRGAAARRQQWRDKSAHAVAARDDAIAQASGRRSRPRTEPRDAGLHRSTRAHRRTRPVPARTRCRRPPPGPARGDRTMTDTEAVDLHVIARLDDPAGAVADLYACELFYSDDGSIYGRHVSCRWESVPATPSAPISLDALDAALTTAGYTRTGEWRRKTTSSGAERYFTVATIRIEDI